MLLFVLTPWIPYGDRQAILIDIGKQQYNFFGLTLWPQDLTLLATLFMILPLPCSLLPPFWVGSGVDICARKRCGRSFLSGLKKSWKLGQQTPQARLYATDR